MGDKNRFKVVIINAAYVVLTGKQSVVSKTAHCTHVIRFCCGRRHISGEEVTLFEGGGIVCVKWRTDRRFYSWGTARVSAAGFHSKNAPHANSRYNFL